MAFSITYKRFSSPNGLHVYVFVQLLFLGQYFGYLANSVDHDQPISEAGCSKIYIHMQFMLSCMI